MTGGGGTSVEPVISYVNKYRDRYHCVIYLTDGHVPVPPVKSRIPMITVITSNGADPRPLRESGMFGNVIKIKR
jgi:predicted metal-dependent peptidase